MSKFVSIAIDGPAGAGKSTMARACAKALGYLYVDTGAIYRTVGYYMRLMGIGPKDQDGIRRLIDEVNIDIRYADGVQHMILNGEDVTGELRTPEMSMYASGVSARTHGCADTPEAYMDISGVRISPVTSAPLRIICCTPSS